MSRRYHRLLLLFVDGVGLAPASPDNPFSAFAAPVIHGLFGGPLASEQLTSRGDRLLTSLDSCLGVDGLPQSATGQATLFTGVNAAARIGRHVAGLPGPQLRQLVGRKSLFRRVIGAAGRTTFANAYSRDYLHRLEAGAVRPSVTTCAARAAGLRLRTTEDLAAGRAVTWDVVGDLFGTTSGSEVERTDPRLAGRRLAALAVDHHLTVYETFLPDLAGHRRVQTDEAEVVRRLDGLLSGILAAAMEDLTIVLTSDHGNFESRSARGHTRNPVPLLAVGPAAGRFRDLGSLVELTPRMLEVLLTPGSTVSHDKI